MATAMNSEPTWIAGRFPISAADLRRSLCSDGWIAMSHTPADSQRLLDYLQLLGDIQPQYGDRLVWDVKPLQAGEATSVGDAAIGFHTELTEFESPPAYVAMFCREQAHSGGELLLLDGRLATDTLSSEAISRLMVDHFHCFSEGTISQNFGPRSLEVPILSLRHDGTLAIRCDTALVTDDTPLSIKDFLRLINELGRTHAIRIRQFPGSLVIWDNSRILHARSGFRDKSRHLWRICIAATHVGQQSQPPELH